MDVGLLTKARRLVVKVGSSLLVDEVTGAADRAWIAQFASDLARLRRSGQQVLIISSGAVALGRARIGLPRKRVLKMEEKQAAAAAGQSLLMRIWEEAFEPHGIAVAQALLTRDDTESRRRWLNARATLEALLRLGAVPIVNENDTVATEEIRFGDNDKLSGRISQMVAADLLVLLSDVDGFYTADPRRDPAARHLPHIGEVGPEHEAMAEGANVLTGVGTGGMRSKLAGARIAGCPTFIAPGRTVDLGPPLAAIEHGGRCTLVAPPVRRMTAYKRWISGSAHAGVLVADAGAVSALWAGKSLLSAGVQGVEGRFVKGDPVLVVDQQGREVARGIAAVGAADAGAAAGSRDARAEPPAGNRSSRILIHRSHLTMVSGPAQGGGRPDEAS